jgi:acyl-CoA synthetase (AMP-forming)/AMP-acid ligase II
MLERSARRYRNGIALRYGDVSLTYEELNGRVNALGNAMLGIGLKHGDRVAIIQNNCHQLLESILCCFKVGFAAVPINAKLSPSEMRYIVGQSESSAVLLGQDFSDLGDSLVSQIPSIRLIHISRTSAEGLDYEKLINDHSRERPNTGAGIDDIAWLFYTSGTTGKPKGAMLTQRNLIVMIMNFLADLYPLQSNEVGLHAAPLTHGSGLYALPFFCRGATNLVLKSKTFDPQLIFRTIEEERIPVLPFLSPTMIKLLLMSPKIGEYDLSSLKCIIYGGGPMYVEDIKEGISRFGRILVQIYGLGEAPMTITTLAAQEHVTEGVQSKRLFSAGLPRTDVEVRIITDDGEQAPHLQHGEIIVRGDIVMKGYWKDPKATAEAIKDGWLYTGDIGYMDDSGYVYILDRSKDMIDSGGAKIYPREVEEVVLRHPSVQEVAVIGVPDRVWGESVKAVVVLKPGMKASQSDIIEFCKENIASYKKPRSVEFVDSIPKNAYGKILKRELRERYWTGMERRI